MDDVEVSDGDSPYTVEKAPLRNPDMTPLSLNVGELLSLYGWYLLFGTLLVYLLIQYLSRRISSQRSPPPPPTPQDVALVARRQEAMEAARMKMQEELDAKASIFREKQKQQEEEKRRQKIEIWDSMQTGKSFRGTATPSQPPAEASSSAAARPKPDKKPLRSADYSPLSGQEGGSCTFRPGRRGPSAGG